MFWICLISVIGVILFALGFVLGLKFSSEEIMKLKKLSSKHLDLFKIAVKWIKDSQKIENYIRCNGYKRIGIYGMSYLGDCLEDVLIKSGMGALYGIDKNADILYNMHIPIYKIENALPTVDVIIITTIMTNESIKQKLKNKMGTSVDIVSLEDILYQ